MDTPTVNQPAAPSQTPSSEGGHKQLIIWAVVALVVLVAGYFLFKSLDYTPAEPTVFNEPAEGVEVARGDLASASKLPAGFPASIPVEQDTVTESYRAVYTEQGVTQHTVSYSSTRSKEAIWEQYSSYMANNGYVLNQTSTSMDTGNMIGTKDNTELGVLVVEVNNRSYVTVNYIERE